MTFVFQPGVVFNTSVIPLHVRENARKQILPTFCASPSVLLICPLSSWTWVLYYHTAVSAPSPGSQATRPHLSGARGHHQCPCFRQWNQTEGSRRLLFSFLEETQSWSLMSFSEGFVLKPSFECKEPFVCSLLNPRESLCQRGRLPKRSFFSLKPQEGKRVSSTPCFCAKCACAGSAHSPPSRPSAFNANQASELAAYDLTNNVRRMRHKKLHPLWPGSTNSCQFETVSFWIMDHALFKSRLLFLLMNPRQKKGAKWGQERLRAFLRPQLWLTQEYEGV